MKSKSVTIFGHFYESVSSAATDLGISKSSLLKAVQNTSLGHELDISVRKLIANKRGQHKTSVCVNSIAYRSLTDAGRALGVTGNTVGNWCKQQGSRDLVIGKDKLSLKK